MLGLSGTSSYAVFVYLCICICVFLFVYLSMRHLLIAVMISLDQELSENVRFVWSKTSHSGDVMPVDGQTLESGAVFWWGKICNLVNHPSQSVDQFCPKIHLFAHHKTKLCCLIKFDFASSSRDAYLPYLHLKEFADDASIF